MLRHRVRVPLLANCTVFRALLLASAPILLPPSAWSQPAQQQAPVAHNNTWTGAIEAAIERTAEDADAQAVGRAAQARGALANNRFASPLEVDGAARQDIIGSGTGYREVEAGIGTSLWRQGERAALRSQADALGATGQAQLGAARLKIAGDVRSAWWAYELAEADVRVAREQTSFAQELIANTNRLVEAGEQARLDLPQAQNALAQAQSLLAEAEGRKAEGQAKLVGLIGNMPSRLPVETPRAGTIENHPLVLSANAEAEHLGRQAVLARVQGEPAWRVGLDMRAQHDMKGVDTNTSTGLRLSRPLGKDPSARAEAAILEAQATATRRRGQAIRIQVETDIAQAAGALAAARANLIAAQAGSATSAEALTLTQRGWQEGELAFVELIRARSAAAEGARMLALARVRVDTAISAFNQAQGLLPQDTTR